MKPDLDNNSFREIYSELYSGSDGLVATGVVIGDRSIASTNPYPKGYHHDTIINQTVDEILAFLIKQKQSNNYILNETYKKHIDSFFEFTKHLKSKGIKSISFEPYMTSLKNSNYLLVDTTSCTGTTAEKESCKVQKVEAAGVNGIINNMFQNLFIDDENKRIKALEAQDLITTQQAAKALAEQQEAQNKLNAQKQKETYDSEQQLLLKQQFDAQKKQTEKERNQKLLVGGGIMVLLVIGSFIGYKKWGK